MNELPAPIVPWPHCRGVYFVRLPGFNLVKIGMADIVSDRLRGLNGGFPVQLELLLVEGTRSSPSKLERQMHRRFAKDRRRGEWFTLSDRLRSFIRERRAEESEPYWVAFLRFFSGHFPEVDAMSSAPAAGPRLVLRFLEQCADRQAAVMTLLPMLHNDGASLDDALTTCSCEDCSAPLDAESIERARELLEDWKMPREQFSMNPLTPEEIARFAVDDPEAHALLYKH